MGTQKSYKGPPGRSPLLPPWAPDLHDGVGDAGEGDAGEGNGETPPAPQAGSGLTPALDSTAAPQPGPFEPTTPDVTWRSPSGFARRLARSPGSAGRDRHRDVSRSFVRALGGARQAARSAPAARNAARSLGSFLSGVARDGIVATAARFGFSAYLGSGVNALLAALVRAFAPAGSDLDEAVARRASVETFVEMLKQYDVEAQGPEGLDALDEAGVRQTMERFVANCVADRLLQTLAGKIEAEAINAARAKEIEDELRDFISASVALEFGNTTLTDLAWDSREAGALIDRLFEGAYGVLEAST